MRQIIFRALEVLKNMSVNGFCSNSLGKSETVVVLIIACKVCTHTEGAQNEEKCLWWEYKG